jgi:hypothetical protein
MSPMVDRHGFVMAGYFEGPKPAVARIARHLGLDPERRLTRVGRVWRLQFGQYSGITAERYNDALRLWESMS